MDRHTIQSLVEYGLSEREATIYTYLLQKLEAPVFDIATSTKTPRTTTYSTLELLKRKGLLSSFRKNNVLFYTPANPNKLLQHLKHKEEVITEILPALQDLVNKNPHKPEIQLFPGVDGLKFVLEDVLATCAKHNIASIYAAAHPELLDALPRYFPEWVKRRAAQQVFTHLIIPDSVRHRKEYYSGYYRETRFLPGNFPFQCSMDIYGHKLAFFSIKGSEIYSVIIESPTISEMFKQFFLFTWEMLGKRV